MPLREIDIRTDKVDKPHVVVLGAGCSRAACPHGDANGAKLPLMDDSLDTVHPLKLLLKDAGISVDGRNFEDAYSELHQMGRTDVENEVEHVVRSYFRSLCLPSEPTLYDYLLLSLREKDVIATFNWDPFLIQAATRNSVWSDRLPKLLFLHGNLLAGSCLEHKTPIQAPIYVPCPKCESPLIESRLLYPISEKNYESVL